jgi:phosphatidate cytidylyltransferase
MKTLITRILSAIAALIIVVLNLYYFQSNGAIAMVLFSSALCHREYLRLVFPNTKIPIGQGVYFFVAMLPLFLELQHPDLGVALIFTSILVILSLQVFKTAQNLLEQSLAVGLRLAFGIIYASALPLFVLKLIRLHSGLDWFLFLLISVLAGDTFAYLFGRLWGTTKLLPQVSPSKTRMGSFGGALGSFLCGGAYSYLALGSSLRLASMMAFISLAAGILGQAGDLFESLLKRIADRKDSGTLMPGHGGILDRLDGVLFAAPWIYAVAFILEN